MPEVLTAGIELQMISISRPVRQRAAMLAKQRRGETWQIITGMCGTLIGDD